MSTHKPQPHTPSLQSKKSSKKKSDILEVINTAFIKALYEFQLDNTNVKKIKKKFLLLIERGLDLNHIDSNRSTAFMRAGSGLSYLSIDEYKEIVSLFLEHGANLHHLNISNYGVFYWVATRKESTIEHCRFLLELGAPVFQPTPEGEDIIYGFIRHNFQEKLDFLLPYWEQHYQDLSCGERQEKLVNYLDFCEVMQDEWDAGSEPRNIVDNMALIFQAMIERNILEDSVSAQTIESSHKNISPPQKTVIKL